MPADSLYGMSKHGELLRVRNDRIHALTIKQAFSVWYGRLAHASLMRASPLMPLVPRLSVRALAPLGWACQAHVHAAESSLAPPGLNEKVKAEGRMTPMSTIQKCIDMFIKPSCKLTGQIAENCMDQNVLRSIPPWLNDTARTNWAEFWDVDRQDAALKLDGDYLVI